MDLANRMSTLAASNTVFNDLEPHMSDFERESAKNLRVISRVCHSVGEDAVELAVVHLENKLATELIHCSWVLQWHTQAFLGAVEH
jgi:hypothetical protein